MIRASVVALVCNCPIVLLSETLSSPRRGPQLCHVCVPVPAQGLAETKRSVAR